MTVRCVAFDLDDTLYLERDYVRSGFWAVGRWIESHVGVTDFADRSWALFLEGRRRDIFDRVLDDLNVVSEPSLIGSLVATYRSHTPNIHCVDDAVEFLRLAYGRLPMALVTDGPSVSQRAKVTGLGLGRWCKPIIFTSECGSPKPHPASFQRVSDHLSLFGLDCVYVADNPRKDFQGPRALGWRTVRVGRDLLRSQRLTRIEVESDTSN